MSLSKHFLFRLEIYVLYIIYVIDYYLYQHIDIFYYGETPEDNSETWLVVCNGLSKFIFIPKNCTSVFFFEFIFMITFLIVLFNILDDVTNTILKKKQNVTYFQSHKYFIFAGIFFLQVMLLLIYFIFCIKYNIPF